MKKTLLFFVVLLAGVVTFAQQTNKYAPLNRKAMAIQELNVPEPASSGSSAILPAYTPKSIKGANMDVKKVFMGTSRNALTLLVTEQNCMFYNKEVNAVMGTFRGNDKPVSGLPAPLGTGNQICTYWSSDAGNTFTGKISASVSGSSFRYPSGVIYNPAGNTDMNAAYSVVAGPRTATAWDYTYLSSLRYDGTNSDVQQPSTSSYKELVRQGMSSCSDGTVHICTMKYATDYKTAIGFVYNGQFNNNTLAFEWTPVDVPIPFNVAPDGTFDAYFGWANMAWSKDGSVGYLMFRGADSRATGNKGFYPIIFKSTDKGATWTAMDYFDFSVFPVLSEHIWPTLANQNVYVPFFTEADLVVDGAGNPHIMGLCQGQYSLHPDSLGYTYSYETGNVFEFSYENDQWFCHYVAHNQTRDVPAASSPFIGSSGAQGWNMRLQASRTDDGSKVFAVWTDTDWQFWGLTDSLNLYPDVYAWGRDLNTNQSTDVKNITFMNEGMGESHFMFVSPVTQDNAGVYDVPLSISDINTNALNVDEPIAHYYLQGVTLTDADFVTTSVPDKPIAGSKTITNYPNPFSGETKIDFNMSKSANVSLVVTSLTGQQVSNVNYGLMGAGTQTITFDASKLTSGVYFFTLTTGDQKATGKMVIK
jgi:hypothetical protein